MTCDGSITALTRKRTKSVVRCELLMNDALLKKTISPELISSASESHLLIFLPLILDVIQATDGVSPLLPPLKARMLASRKLKLRFLLLRKHPAFKDFKARLRFSSAAYGQLPFGGDATKLNRCRALPPPDYLDHFTVPVDMVSTLVILFFKLLLSFICLTNLTFATQSLYDPIAF